MISTDMNGCNAYFYRKHLREILAQIQHLTSFFFYETEKEGILQISFQEATFMLIPKLCKDLIE